MALAIAIMMVSIPNVLASSADIAGTTPSIIQIDVEHNHPVEPVVKIPWQLNEIARCESGNSHFDSSGNVIRGKVNPQDIGKYQINLRYHEATATKMGLDLFSEDDNETYAMYLYKKQGAQPWSASNHCHKLLD